MNALIDQIYRTKRVQDADGNERDAFPAAIAYADGAALHRIVRDTGANDTLEIGLALGVSALFILQAYEGKGLGHHTAVDPWQEKWFNNIGLSNIERAGLDQRFTFIEKPSHLALPGLIHQEKKVDFAFIDGNHRFEYTMVDFFSQTSCSAPVGTSYCTTLGFLRCGGC